MTVLHLDTSEMCFLQFLPRLLRVSWLREDAILRTAVLRCWFCWFHRRLCLHTVNSPPLVEAMHSHSLSCETSTKLTSFIKLICQLQFIISDFIFLRRQHSSTAFYLAWYIALKEKNDVAWICVNIADLLGSHTVTVVVSVCHSCPRVMIDWLIVCCLSVSRHISKTKRDRREISSHLKKGVAEQAYDVRFWTGTS